MSGIVLPPGAFWADIEVVVKPYTDNQHWAINRGGYSLGVWPTDEMVQTLGITPPFEDPLGAGLSREEAEQIAGPLAARGGLNPAYAKIADRLLVALEEQGSR